MPDGTTDLTLSLHRSIHDIGAAAWDACAGDDNPFVSFAFLSALEDSGSAGAKTGWLPQHAALRSAGRVVAVAPMYAKGHSYGEYVFDHGWANALERAGGRYYPKLQVAVPFTPVPGPRLLIRPDAVLPREAVGRALAQACAELGLSSVHITFCRRQEWDALGEDGWLRRLGVQFHWHNRGYATYEDFLATLASRKRKALRKERATAAAGLAIAARCGAEILPRHWDAFWRFYRNTTDRKWGSAYLTRSFFPLMAERLGDRVVLILAERDGTPIAGALNLLGRDALYGRNWGCTQDVPFLHFELCYHRAIDFAIAHGIPRVEAGAQGEHKIQRGYEPVETYSLHWIAHPGLRGAVAEFLDRERPAMAEEIAALGVAGPYRRGDENTPGQTGPVQTD
jgi:hypothetical protein